MDSLVDNAWRLYHEAQNAHCAVRPSIPILFFGDRSRYFRSPPRIITVALNPSRREFPEGDRFARFPKAVSVYPGILDGLGREDYGAALNDYFRQRPYRSWFPWFDKVLRGMEASYYDGEVNTALHTDLCSPLATDPTWSRLGDE